MKPLTKGQYEFVPGKSYGSPKEIWGFRSAQGKGSARQIARAFLKANAPLMKLEEGLGHLVYKLTVKSLGARHVIHQQEHLGLRVHRAYVTVHVGNDDRVFLAKNRAMPRKMLPAKHEFVVDWDEARSLALKEAGTAAKSVDMLDTEDMWFPSGKRLREAIRVRFHRNKPAEDWIVFIDGRDGSVLAANDNLSHASGRAIVFDPNPVVALGDHELLLTPGGDVRDPPLQAYTIVPLEDLDGNGRLEGRRVTTKPTPSAERVLRKSHDFFLLAGQRGFEEVMVYFHIDRAVRYLESLGFKGGRAIFRGPVEVAVNGTPADESFYSPGKRLLTFGTGDVDDAEDAETILHEFGHALQDAICPGFGRSKEAAAMGEGFGDYFAGSFFAEQKSDVYRDCIISWDGLFWQQPGETPCLRRLDSRETFAKFSNRRSEHKNGEIWSATLWDIRAALGRELADTLILESQFQLDGYTRFAKGARAIVDADDNLFGGKHRAALLAVFRKRKIKPVA